MDVLKCTAYESIPLSGKDLVSLRQLRHNRDEPENIDHELWRDSEKALPSLNLFTVSAVGDLQVCLKNVGFELMIFTTLL